MDQPANDKIIMICSTIPVSPSSALPVHERFHSSAVLGHIDFKNSKTCGSPPNRTEKWKWTDIGRGKHRVAFIVGLMTCDIICTFVHSYDSWSWLLSRRSSEAYVMSNVNCSHCHSTCIIYSVISFADVSHQRKLIMSQLSSAIRGCMAWETEKEKEEEGEAE